MFRMDATQKATQAAMAAEIGSRLGRMNRSKAWLHREAGISASAWRHYFKAYDRDVPLSVVRSVAAVLGTTVGELVTLAEEAAPEFAGDFLRMNPQERAEWNDMIFRPPTDNTGDEEGQGSNTGS